MHDSKYATPVDIIKSFNLCIIKYCVDIIYRSTRNNCPFLIRCTLVYYFPLVFLETNDDLCIVSVSENLVGRIIDPPDRRAMIPDR